MCFFVIFSQDKYHNVGKRQQHCGHTLVGTVNNTEHKSYKWKHRRSELINFPSLTSDHRDLTLSIDLLKYYQIADLTL